MVQEYNKYFRHMLTCLILWIIKCRRGCYLLVFVKCEFVR